MAPVETEYYDLVCGPVLDVAASDVLIIALRNSPGSLATVAVCLRGCKRYRFEEGLSEASHEGSIPFALSANSPSRFALIFVLSPRFFISLVPPG